jgi:hypothetical protein
VAAERTDRTRTARAARRQVVQTEGAPDNVDQRDSLRALRFPDASFDVVCARHESYVAAEVARSSQLPG